jgi:hypothetical protein
MTENYGLNASGDERTNNRPPRTRAVAVALKVRPGRLTEFVDCHPDPTPKTVFALADRPPVDQNTRDMVARWVTAQTTSNDTSDVGQCGGDAGGLAGLARRGNR